MEVSGSNIEEGQLNTKGSTIEREKQPSIMTSRKELAIRGAGIMLLARSSR